MVKKRPASSNAILRAIVSLGEQVADLPTKNNVEKMIDDAKEHILREIHPIARAVDKDAETVIKHEKRITRIESHLSLK